MSLIEDRFLTDEIHPIDIVETVAEHRDWEFDRVTDDQIAMAVQGQWRSYSLTLAWSGGDETLRLICTFDMDPPDDRLPALMDLLNLINDEGWSGGFGYWAEQKLLVWRYGLLLSGGQVAAPEQVDAMIRAAIAACERYYPAFQLTAWSDRTAEDALQVAMAPAWGRA
jgi:hypothetical protein